MRVIRCSAVALLPFLVAACDVTIPVVEPLGASPSDGGGVAASGESGVEASSPDAASDASDAATLGSGPFAAPTLLTAVSDPQSDNEDPSLSADGLELYFMSTRSGNNDIWLSQRASLSDPWDTPQIVSELSTPAGEAEPFIAADGLTIWFSTNRDADAGSGYHIWVATRANGSAAWGTPEPVAELWSPGTDGKPSVDEAELVMAFMSDRDGGAGGMDIYTASRATREDPWGVPVNVAAVNTANDERDPFLGPQDLQLFWAASSPSAQIASASRTSVAQSFSSSVTLGELGTPDFDDALSADLRHILFARGPAGAQEIYEAFR